MLHLTWISFFLSFVVWFNLAPFASTIGRVMNLTAERVKTLLICNVALTIPARIAVGMQCRQRHDAGAGKRRPPTAYADIELADAFFFIGSNAADCHPITFGRVQRRVEKGRAECIVVDPRRTATAEAATLHLPIRPGTDLALLNGLLYLLYS